MKKQCSDAEGQSSGDKGHQTGQGVDPDQSLAPLATA